MQNKIINKINIVFAVVVLSLGALVLTASAAFPPVIQNAPASSITATSATLNGFFNNNGATASTWFQYSTQANLGNAQVTPIRIQSATSGGFSEAITGLSSDTVYYFRAVGSNSAGTTYASSVYSFKTLMTATPNPSGPTPTPSTTNCVINSFTSNPTYVQYGGTATLSWSTTGCSNLTINGMSLSSAVGTRQTTNLYSTGMYVLSGTGQNGTITRSLTITVGAQLGGNGGNGIGGNNPPVLPSNCSVTTFYANPTFVNNGTSSTLVWSTANCASVEIVGGGFSGSQALTGSLSTGALGTTTTYTLYAKDNYGVTFTRQATVNVLAQNVPQPQNNCLITNFYASPNFVSAGSSTTLVFGTSNCFSTKITGSGSFPSYMGSSGTFTTGQLYGNTSFTLTAYGTNTVSQTIQVSVQPQQQIIIPQQPVYVQPPVYIQPTPVFVPQNFIFACNDGRDNDGDGRIDMNDAGCNSTNDDNELNSTVTNIIREVVNTNTTTTNTSGTTNGNGAVSIQSEVDTDGLRSDYDYRGGSLAGLALFGGSFLPTTFIGWLMLILVIWFILLLASRLYGSKNNNHANNH